MQNKAIYDPCILTLPEKLRNPSSCPSQSNGFNGHATDRPKELEGVGITEHLGTTVGVSNLSFKDEQGNSAPLSSYFKKNHPVILALVYYECPNLCNLLLNGLVESLNKLDWTPGDQFEVITVSINPRETPLLARQKKSNYLKIYHRPQSEKGWHFLTGEENQIQALASQLGFQYRYDPVEKQYSHTAALFILTPQGKISRYLYGISFPMKNLRLSLMEASNGAVGTVMDRVILFCFHFDPNRNSYTLKMWRIVQAVLVIQVMALALFMFLMWKKERPKKSEVEGV